jgi:hypothetical protein
MPTGRCACAREARCHASPGNSYHLRTFPRQSPSSFNFLLERFQNPRHALQTNQNHKITIYTAWQTLGASTMSDSFRHHSRRHRDRDGHRERDSSRRRHRERDSSSSRRDSRRDRDRTEKSERLSKKRTRSPPPTLPMNAIPIGTRDFDLLSSVFSSYLDVQKGLNLSELDERMAKSRFKSFVSH